MNDKLKTISDLLAKNPLMSMREISRVTGIPRTTVRRYVYKLTFNSNLKDKGPEEDLKLKEVKTKTQTLEKKYNEALDIIKNLKEENKALLNLSVSKKPSAITFKNKDKQKREVVPVIVASDWHIEEYVDSAVTNGLNTYNIDVAKKSICQFFTNASFLVNREKASSKVNTVVLAILGDIINGVLREEDLQNNKLTSIEAVSLARNLIYDGIKFLSEETDCDIRVICCTGNHGRLTDKIFASNQVKNSLEYLMYKTLERDFRDDPKVNVFVSEAYYYIQEVLGVKIRFHHGHIFKFNGGIGGLAVPVLRKISQMNLIENADLDVCGHFHSMQIFNNCILNGSLVGANGYSIQLGIPFEPPRQTFFLIDEKYKRSTITPIFIDREVKK